MRTVVRNSFARQTIRAERVQVARETCAECGSQRSTARAYGPADPVTGGRYARVRTWLYRFHVDDDQGSRQSGPIAGGKLFCSRGCCESYTGRALDETEG